MFFRDKKSARPHLASVLLGVAAALIFMLFLARSDIAIEYMKKGLKLCANTVIPSLFPFMVISELIVASGVGTRVGRVISRPVGWLFGVSEGGACAFILGIVCGFPIGAKALCSMLDRGEILKDEASRALTFCNNPGSAFVISAVGVSLFGSLRLGVTLYICVILSAAVVGAFGRLFFRRITRKGPTNKPYETDIRKTNTDAVGIFTSAIRSSALSMLTVCALVAFFSSLVGCLGAILESLGAPTTLTSAIFAFFELSSGVGMAADLPPTAAILLSSAALGWSGLSVHFQVMTVASGRNISFKPYFIAKFCQGIVCAALTAIALKLFPLSEEAFAEIYASLSQESTYSNAAFVCTIFFFASILPILINRIYQKQCKKSKRKIF